MVVDDVNTLTVTAKASADAVAESPKLSAPTRRHALQLGLATGFTAAASGLLLPARSAFADTPKRGGAITVASADSSTADTLDPARASNTTDYSRLFMFYNGLTVFDEHLTPLPDLATSVETSDAQNWTIKLRSGVTFHDGSPLTSADVVFSLARHKDPAVASVIKPLASQMQEIKATGPLEVQVTLAQPNVELPTILAIYQFVIVKAGTTDFSKGMGTGPFICKEFSPGVRSVGVRNPNYFHPGQPYLDQITYIGITDDSARVNALLSGDIDVAGGVDSHTTPQIKSTSGFSILESKGGEYTNLIMHLDAPTAGNPDFVKAIKYLQDRERIKSRVFLDYAVIGNDQPVNPFNPYYDPTLPQTLLDIDRAKFHLKKAGMAGATVPLVCSPAATGSVDIAIILQSTAAQAGLNIQVQRVPSDGYWSNYWLKAPFTFGNIIGRPSASILLTLFFRSTAPWNESHWKNPTFDKLLTAAASETDAAKRRQMYAEMQRLIHDQAGIGIPVFISDIDAYANRVKGWRPLPTGGLMGYNFAQHIWLDG
jgi:peptide/nickel transport system substrate-binding protein